MASTVQEVTALRDELLLASERDRRSTQLDALRVGPLLNFRLVLQSHPHLTPPSPPRSAGRNPRRSGMKESYSGCASCWTSKQPRTAPCRRSWTVCAT